MGPAIYHITATKLISVPYYTEGPVTDQEGNCYFTTLAGGVIYKMNSEGGLSEWTKAVCPNGQVILPNGDHLVCDSKLATLSRFNCDGDFLKNEVEGRCAGMPVYVPNDVIADRNGGVYFTDSIRDSGKIGYKGPDGTEHILAQNLDYPNGLVLSEDERFLFVAESYKNRILIFSLKAPGISDGPFNVFANLPRNAIKDVSKNLPDGTKIDKYGNLWVAHYGMSAVQVLNKEGMLIQTIQTGIPLTSNLCLFNNEVIITGGYNEPGPGAILKIILSYDEKCLQNL